MDSTNPLIRKKAHDLKSKQLAEQFPHSIFKAIAKQKDKLRENRRGFTPTDAMPGTREKLDVLARRVERGNPLHHDDDVCDYEHLEQLPFIAEEEDDESYRD